MFFYIFANVFGNNARSPPSTSQAAIPELQRWITTRTFGFVEYHDVTVNRHLFLENKCHNFIYSILIRHLCQMCFVKSQWPRPLDSSSVISASLNHTRNSLQARRTDGLTTQETHTNADNDWRTSVCHTLDTHTVCCISYRLCFTDLPLSDLKHLFSRILTVILVKASLTPYTPNNLHLTGSRTLWKSPEHELVLSPL